MGILANLGLTSNNKKSVKAQYAPAIMDVPYGTWFGNNNFGGYNNYVNAIDRQAAVSVPAVTRCLNLVKGVISSIPLETYSTSTGQELPNLVWIDQPDKRQPRSVTIAWTVDSLFFYGAAYWRVTEIYQDDGRPARFEWVQNDRVSQKLNKNNTEVEYYMVDSVRVPMEGLGSLVTFQAMDQGLLLRAARTIKSAIDIETAAAVASQTPMPSGYIRNTGADLPDAQVQGLLATWKQARQNRSTAYLTSSLEYQPASFSPKDMMYNEAVQNLSTQIARAMNVPAYYLSADQNTTMTYANVQDERKQFYALSIEPYVKAIESRLSMDDISTSGHEVKFAVSDTFLQQDPLVEIQVLEKLLTLGLITTEQAMEMTDLTPNGSEGLS